MTRTKISVAIEEQLVDEVDRRVQGRRYRSRSQAIERAVAQWLEAEREREITAYYDSLSHDELAEGTEWDEAAGHAFAELSGALRASDRPRPDRGSKARPPSRKK